VSLNEQVTDTKSHTLVKNSYTRFGPLSLSAEIPMVDTTLDLQSDRRKCFETEDLSSTESTRITFWVPAPSTRLARSDQAHRGGLAGRSKPTQFDALVSRLGYLTFDQGQSYLAAKHEE
jgi:hypothetical protein